MNILNFKKEKLLILLSIMYVIPIILANVYYIDDMARITGGHGWNPDGRVFTTILMQAVSFGITITSTYPYSIIIASLVTAFSGYLSASVIFKDNKINITITSLILLTSPFYLENLSYRYDSLPMSLSLLFAITPFLFSNKKHFFLISLICIILSLGLYQVSSMAYFSLLICILISDIKSLTFRKHGLLIFLSLVSFIVSYYIYISIIDFMGVSLSRGGFIEISPNTISILWYRINRYHEIYTWLANSGYSIAIIPLFSLLVISLFLMILNEGIAKFKTIIIYLFLISSLISLTTLPNLILADPWYTARTMMCFPFIIYGVIALCSQYINKNILCYSIIVLLIYSFVLSSVFGSVLKNNEEYDNFLSQSISQEIMKNTDKKSFKVVIVGTAKTPQRSALLYSAYPIITKLAPIYSTQDWFWGVKNLSRYLNFEFMTERETVYKNMCSYEILSHNQIYSIRTNGDLYVINFNEDKCK